MNEKNKKVLSWTRHALKKKAESARTSGNKIMRDVFLNVLYLYDLEVIDIEWHKGDPVLSCKEDFSLKEKSEDILKFTT